MKSELLQITQEIAACRKCLDDTKTYVSGRSVLASDWAPPRGWAGTADTDIDIVLVALNPGGPLPGERELYKKWGLFESNRRISTEQVEALSAYCLEQYRTPRRGQNWIFHRKSVALARCLLWLLDGRDPGPQLWGRCWFTDIFKCSTRSESSPLIKDAAFDACWPFFEREIAAIKPKLIVALGGAARDRLRQVCDQPFVSFRHPSNGCPRLDAKFHDTAFEEAAHLLKVAIPENFVAARRRAHDDAKAM